MITNFETYTPKLTKSDEYYATLLASWLRLHTTDNPKTSKEVVDGFNFYYGEKVLTGVKLRKMVNRMRSDGSVPIIATSQGYFVSYDKDVITKQIESLKQRASAILNSANGLQSWLK